MSGSCRFLDIPRPFALVVESMRRVLRIRTAFEPTRSSEQQLQLAYERVVETIRRTLTRDGNGLREERESDVRNGTRREA